MQLTILFHTVFFLFFFFSFYLVMGLLHIKHDSTPSANLSLIFIQTGSSGKAFLITWTSFPSELKKMKTLNHCKTQSMRSCSKKKKHKHILLTLQQITSSLHNRAFFAAIICNSVFYFLSFQEWTLLHIHFILLSVLKRKLTWFGLPRGSTAFGSE